LNKKNYAVAKMFVFVDKRIVWTFKRQLPGIRCDARFPGIHM